MNSRDKKLIVVIAVLFVAAIGYGVYQYQKNQVHVVGTIHLPPNSFPKAQWAKEHATQLQQQENSSK